MAAELIAAISAVVKLSRSSVPRAAICLELSTPICVLVSALGLVDAERCDLSVLRPATPGGEVLCRDLVWRKRRQSAGRQAEMADELIAAISAVVKPSRSSEVRTLICREESAPICVLVSVASGRCAWRRAGWSKGRLCLACSKAAICSGENAAMSAVLSAAICLDVSTDLSGRARDSTWLVRRAPIWSLVRPAMPVGLEGSELVARERGNHRCRNPSNRAGGDRGHVGGAETRSIVRSERRDLLRVQRAHLDACERLDLDGR